MSTSYADLLSLADKNARKTAEQLEDERRKRERMQRLQEKPRPVDDAAIKQILERRRREQEQQKIAEKQRLKLIKELEKQKQTQLPLSNSTKKQPSKSLSASKQPARSAPPPPPPPKPSVVPKKSAPNIPYEQLMRYASLKANQQPIPKDLQHVAESLRANKSNSTKKQLPPPPPPPTKNPSKSISSSNNAKQPVRPSSSSVPSSSSSKVPSTQKHRATTIEQRSNRNSATQKPSQPLNRTVANGQRPSSAQSNGQRSSQLLSRSSTSQSNRNLPPMNRPRPVSSNGQRSSLPPSRKRPILDTDDEDDGADLEDFIVDDDDDDNDNNGFDYRKELQDTLRTNFRFDIDRYRRRIIDEDDDDLRNMESSYAQIEKEEDYSARVGLKEDIDDILREQAEKKRLSQMKKRPKTAA